MQSPKRKQYSLPEQTLRNWNDALSKPQDITVEVIETR